MSFIFIIFLIPCTIASFNIPHNQHHHLPDKLPLSFPIPHNANQTSNSTLAGAINGINQDVLVTVMLLLTIPLTFFGASIFTYIVGLMGFVIFGGIGYYVFSHTKDSLNLSTAAVDALSILLGVFGGIFLQCAIKAAIYLIGALTGWIIIQLILICGVQLQWFDAPPDQVFWLIAISSSFFGGLIVSKFHHFLLRGITAFIGGFFMASGCVYISQKIDHTANHWLDVFSFFSPTILSDPGQCNIQCQIYFGYWACFFTAGTLVQCHALVKSWFRGYGPDEPRRIALLSDEGAQSSENMARSHIFTVTDAKHLEDRCETMINRLRQTQKHYEEEIQRLQDLRHKLELEHPPVQGPQGLHSNTTRLETPQQLNVLHHIIERPPPPLYPPPPEVEPGASFGYDRHNPRGYSMRVHDRHPIALEAIT